jgi:hypothetical protein
LRRSTLALPEIEMQSDTTPQARRRARTAERLREALAHLLRDGSRRPTVAALAREAGIGRNAIHANHRTTSPICARLPPVMEPTPKESVMPIAGWSTGA